MPSNARYMPTFAPVPTGTVSVYSEGSQAAPAQVPLINWREEARLIEESRRIRAARDALQNAPIPSVDTTILYNSETGVFTDSQGRVRDAQGRFVSPAAASFEATAPTSPKSYAKGIRGWFHRQADLEGKVQAPLAARATSGAGVGTASLDTLL